MVHALTLPRDHDNAAVTKHAHIAIARRDVYGAIGSAFRVLEGIGDVIAESQGGM
jgi:hypothetical protein